MTRREKYEENVRRLRFISARLVEISQERRSIELETEVLCTSIDQFRGISKMCPTCRVKYPGSYSECRSCYLSTVNPVMAVERGISLNDIDYVLIPDPDVTERVPH